MSFLKSFNRHMERNQAASLALLEQLEKASITDLDQFNAELWQDISTCSNGQYLIEVLDHEETSLAFIVKIFVKIGFSCEDSVRLMMKLQKQGSVVLAIAEEKMLVRLQDYINLQAKRHGLYVSSRIAEI